MKFRYTYDSAFDLLDFSCDDEFKFKRSVKLDEGIYLDFDDGGRPIALEIIGVSKIFRVLRKHLVEPYLEFHIEITSDLIRTEIKFHYLINQQKRNVSIENEVSNDYMLPPIEMTITN